MVSLFYLFLETSLIIFIDVVIPLSSLLWNLVFYSLCLVFCGRLSYRLLFWTWYSVATCSIIIAC